MLRFPAVDLIKGWNMDAIRREDNDAHQPGPGADPRWQESWFLAWYDPGGRAGGFHHVGLQRLAGRADVWSWLALDGEVVGKFQSLDLALPEDDLPDLAIGGMQVVTKTPLRSLALSAEYPGARTEVVYEAFSEDLFCSIFTMTTAAGRQDFGYVHDAGHFHRVTRMDTGARVADDGHSPTGCDARIQTEGGRGYRITGTVDVASASSHDDIFFTDGFSVFECGGRLGSGIFEVHELAGPAPWHRQARGL